MPSNADAVAGVVDRWTLGDLVARAAELIAEVAGGEILQGRLDAFIAPAARPPL